MRKVLFLIALLGMVSCNDKNKKHDQGGENACQYVREQAKIPREDIASVEVISEDSVLSSNLLSSGTKEIWMERHKYSNEEVTAKYMMEFCDSMMHLSFDVMDSWLTDKNKKDSLKQLPKYNDSWAKLYNIELTMKSGKKQTYCVCMDEDGVTPLTTESEMLNLYDCFQDALK